MSTDTTDPIDNQPSFIETKSGRPGRRVASGSSDRWDPTRIQPKPTGSGVSGRVRSTYLQNK